MDYVLLPLAEDDLEDIWIYIATDNENAADGMIHKIFAAIEALTRAPLLGRDRGDLVTGLRSFVVSPYIVFYRPLDDIIEIVRVLHGARDVDGIIN